MASLRLKYSDRSRSPPRDNYENYDALNDHQGQRGPMAEVGNNELLQQLRGTVAPAGVTALQARQAMEGRQVLKLANAEIQELKDSLTYAEHMLARTMQEKEGVAA